MKQRFATSVKPVNQSRPKLLIFEFLLAHLSLHFLNIIFSSNMLLYVSFSSFAFVILHIFLCVLVSVFVPAFVSVFVSVLHLPQMCYCACLCICLFTSFSSSSIHHPHSFLKCVLVLHSAHNTSIFLSSRAVTTCG